MRQGSIRFMNDVGLAAFQSALKLHKLTNGDLRRIISTGAVLLNRFFIRNSFKSQDAKVRGCAKRGGNAGTPWAPSFPS